jgi:hypothetical protein
MNPVFTGGKVFYLRDEGILPEEGVLGVLQREYGARKSELEMAITAF